MKMYTLSKWNSDEYDRLVIRGVETECYLRRYRERNYKQLVDFEPDQLSCYVVTAGLILAHFISRNIEPFSVSCTVTGMQTGILPHAETY